jgi:hypothetical protein
VDEFDRLITQAANSIGVEAVRIWPQVVGITFVQSLCNSALGLVILLAGFFG